jgi:hypothetical protein
MTRRWREQDSNPRSRARSAMVTRLRLGASIVEPKGPAPLRQGTGSSNPACRSVSTPRGRSPPLTGLCRHQGPQLIATRFLLPVLRPSGRGAVEMAIELPSAVRKPDCLGRSARRLAASSTLRKCALPIKRVYRSGQKWRCRHSPSNSNSRRTLPDGNVIR